MKRVMLCLTLIAASTAAHAERYTNSSISTAQTWYFTLLGPTAASQASTQLDNIGRQGEDDSLAFIATQGEISGPALERAYLQAKQSNPSVTREQVALEIATR